MLWFTSAALACAGLVTAPLETAESAGSEILFEPAADGAVRVSYNTRWTGDTTDFGWLIPVPGAFVDLADGDAARFDALRTASAPVVEYATVAEDRGCGCSPAGKGDAGGSYGTGSVDVIASGFTGSFEWVVAQADDAASLDAWLSDHGFQTGTAQQDVDAYLAEGDAIAAVRVLPDAPALGTEARLPPIAITYTGPRSYPLRMARHSSEPEQLLTVYAVDVDRSSIGGGWTEDSTASLTVDGDPAAAWTDHLRDVGNAGSWQLTWAGTIDTGFLTRYDALIGAEDAVSDPVFTDEPGNQATAGFVLEAPAPADTGSWLPIVALGWWRRREEGAGGRRPSRGRR